MDHKAIVIAGSGRSGTTWVQDCIAEANGLRTIFEPLGPYGVPEARKYCYRYRDAAVEDPDLKTFMDRVLSGHYRSLWMNYRIRPDRFNFFRVGIANAVFNARAFARNYKKYRGQGNQDVVVKFIRANLMLPWIVKYCVVDALFVTRHPCAVIASRLKLGGKDWSGELDLDRYRSDASIVQLVLNQFSVDITEPFSPVEALAVIWCIENLLPIHWAGGDAGYIVTSYEKLFTQKEHEWERVIGRLGLSQVPDLSLLNSPSQQVSKKMQGKAFSDGNLGKWRQTLTVSQITEISLVLDRFSCSVYSVDEDCSIGI